MADPIHATAISLCQIASQLIQLQPTLDHIVIANILNELQELIGETIQEKIRNPKLKPAVFLPIELRHIHLCLTKQLAAGRAELLKLDEDSDEYMEKANDLMVLDSIIAKIDREQA